MAFNSIEFVIFLIVVLTLHAALASGSTRKMLLLLASYVFYMAWSPPFVLLLVASSLLDYLVGLGLEKQQRSSAARRGLLALSLAGNLGVLGFFKYGHFIGSNVAWLMGTSLEQSALLDIVLPVGISFYTFQSLSYSIDVYRRQLPAARSFLDLALYVAFFPQLVAGPIVRATTFLPQLADTRRVKGSDVEAALARIAGGFIKKVVLADSLGRYCDAVFGNLQAYQGLNLWLVMLAYAYQIYFDFSGYSDIAIGTARLFGFRIPENFDRPYLAASPREFWQRWHISLSTWLRDYLYIGLGGNRRGGGRTGVNLLMTMLLGGLWHGAAWNFVLWGAFHGVWLIAHRLLFSGAARGEPRSPLWLRRGATFAGVCFGWLIFRLSDLDDVLYVLARMWSLEYMATASASVAIAAVGIATALHLGPSRRTLQAGLLRFPPALQGLVYGFAILLVFFFSPATARFIYFQF